MQIVIDDKCLMWNEVIRVLGRHWGAKKEIFDTAKELAHWAIYETPNKKMFTERVDIFVLAKFKNKTRRDSDGICAKSIIDCLVDDGILADDSTKYVRRVSTEAEIGCEKNEVIINIVPII